MVRVEIAGSRIVMRLQVGQGWRTARSPAASHRSGRACVRSARSDAGGDRRAITCFGWRTHERRAARPTSVSRSARECAWARGLRVPQDRPREPSTAPRCARAQPPQAVQRRACQPRHQQRERGKRRAEGTPITVPDRLDPGAAASAARGRRGSPISCSSATHRGRQR